MDMMAGITCGGRAEGIVCLKLAGHIGSHCTAHATGAERGSVAVSLQAASLANGDTRPEGTSIHVAQCGVARRVLGATQPRLSRLALHPWAFVAAAMKWQQTLVARA